ncbi:MAG: hypothetical protein M3Z66_03360, partial [Chloroflexota bacterium]|nr:hypothetical protein [Chloroflexota bacterium]
VVHALLEAGMIPPPARSTWSHEQVQAHFAGELIVRLKLYPSIMRDVLSRTYLLRVTADYTRDVVSETQASRALRRTRCMLVRQFTREEVTGDETRAGTERIRSVP